MHTHRRDLKGWRQVHAFVVLPLFLSTAQQPRNRAGLPGLSEAVHEPHRLPIEVILALHREQRVDSVRRSPRHHRFRRTAVHPHHHHRQEHAQKPHCRHRRIAQNSTKLLGKISNATKVSSLPFFFTQDRGEGMSCNLTFKKLGELFNQTKPSI